MACGRASLPGQKPRLLTSCEYASRVIASGKCGIPPGCGGAGRPEKRVTARSKLPQKKCTGLHLPQNRERRSEEHTSELQSLRHLVCRLLLEKKKNNNIAYVY